MAGFWSGALLGAVVGIGGTYAALQKPWKDAAGVAQVVAHDAGEVSEPAGKKKRKKRRRGSRRGGGGETTYEMVGDDIPELSAADRKMVWKGPPVSLPKKEMDFGDGSDARALNQSEINSGISSQKRRVVQCIADARGNAELSAQITLKFLVDGSGNATKIRMHAPSYLFQNGLEACARGAVQSMRFPATGAPTVVTLPLSLS